MNRVLVPFRVLWASPYTLLGLLLGLVGVLFGGRIRYRAGAFECCEGGTKWLVHQLPNGQFTLAITIGHVILGQTEAALDIAREHEHVHVRQYERWGPFFMPAYFLAGVYQWWNGKRFYRDNPFEREAFDVSERGDDRDRFS